MKQLVLFISAIMLFSGVYAAPKAECSKDLIIAYFPEPFVKETLSRFEVPKDQWAAINNELSKKDDEVIRMVEEKAAKMDPNPLKDPKHRQGAVKIFRESLLQVFSDVMYAHGVTDEKKIQEMLDDIQQQKAEHFVDCMKKQKMEKQEN